MSKLTTVDEGLVQEIGERIALGIKDGLHTFTPAASLRPGNKATISRGIGFAQNGFIGTTLMPEVQASPDGTETAVYPVFAKEMFLVEPDIVGIGGNTKRSDLDMSWTEVGLDVHAHESAADPREVRIANAAGIDLAAKKNELAKAKVEIAKEYSIATLLTTGGNYAGNTVALTTGASGTSWAQFASANSDPVTEVATRDEAMRKKIGRRSNVMFLAAGVYSKLRFHPKIQALVQYGSSKVNPSLPVDASVLAAVFGKTIVIGDAIHTAKLNSAFVDTWGDCAGLLYVADADLYSPQFGFTLTSSGYPKSLQFEDKSRGAEGSQVYRYIDAYRPVIAHANAGFLWTACTV